MQRFFGITPLEYFTVGRRRLQDLSVTCPHFFLRAIWLLAFLVCSSHYLCSSPVKWSFVSCFKSSCVISKSPICARLTHIWSREFYKVVTDDLTVRFRPASSGLGVKSCHVNVSNQGKPVFTLGLEITCELISGSCLKFELCQRFWLKIHSFIYLLEISANAWIP